MLDGPAFQLLLLRAQEPGKGSMMVKTPLFLLEENHFFEFL
jgi:hypothetical protein